MVSEKQALMRELQDTLETLGDGKKLVLKQIEDNTLIAIPVDILFSSGSTILSKRGSILLETMVRVLENYPDRPICIEGQTNTTPIVPTRREGYPANRELSVARALQVMNYMVGRFEIEQHLVSVERCSPFTSTAFGDMSKEKTGDQRVVIVITLNKN